MPKNGLIKYFSASTQFMTWPIAWAFFHLLYKVKVTGHENLHQIKSPIILISNHIASFDSFLFRLVLGFFAHHLPLRFMAVKKFVYPHLNFLSKIGFIDLLYKMFGVFVVTPGLGVEENLKSAIDIINNGGNVVIYPEGKIVKKDGVASFKRGAAVLQLKTNAGVLPISFRIISIEGRARKKIVANIGAPIWIPAGMTEDEITQVFYNNIVSLYERE